MHGMYLCAILSFLGAILVKQSPLSFPSFFLFPFCAILSNVANKGSLPPTVRRSLFPSELVLNKSAYAYPCYITFSSTTFS